MSQPNDRELSQRCGQWRAARAPRGGVWLVSVNDRRITALAPPAVAIALGERGEHMDHWRVASWDGERDGWGSPGACGAPRALSTVEVLRIIPAAHHGWVEEIMRSQVAQCRAFASSRPGSLQREERARAAAARLQWLREDLAEAFPGLRWDAETRRPLPTVPGTVERLLEAVDGVRPPRPAPSPSPVSKRRASSHRGSPHRGSPHRVHPASPHPEECGRRIPVGMRHGRRRASLVASALRMVVAGAAFAALGMSAAPQVFSMLGSGRAPSEQDRAIHAYVIVDPTEHRGVRAHAGHEAVPVTIVMTHWLDGGGTHPRSLLADAVRALSRTEDASNGAVQERSLRDSNASSPARRRAAGHRRVTAQAERTVPSAVAPPAVRTPSVRYRAERRESTERREPTDTRGSAEGPAVNVGNGAGQPTVNGGSPNSNTGGSGSGALATTEGDVVTGGTRAAGSR